MPLERQGGKANMPRKRYRRTFDVICLRYNERPDCIAQRYSSEHGEALMWAEQADTDTHCTYTYTHVLLLYNADENKQLKYWVQSCSIDGGNQAPSRQAIPVKVGNNEKITTPWTPCSPPSSERYNKRKKTADALLQSTAQYNTAERSRHCIRP